MTDRTQIDQAGDRDRRRTAPWCSRPRPSVSRRRSLRLMTETSAVSFITFSQRLERPGSAMRMSCGRMTSRKLRPAAEAERAGPPRTGRAESPEGGGEDLAGIARQDQAERHHAGDERADLERSAEERLRQRTRRRTGRRNRRRTGSAARAGRGRWWCRCAPEARTSGSVDCLAEGDEEADGDADRKRRQRQA